MKDEIKEILDGFKEILNNPTTTDECYDGRIIEIDRGYDLDLDEIKLLLDYITNLQEENKEIKNTIDFIDNKYKNTINYNEKLIEYNQDYKSRIEKAIEYIKNDWYELNTRDIEHCINLNKDIRIDLLNILQGVGKDE